MPKIKEIKKIESKIKEIKKEKKETLEEEVEELKDDSPEFSRIRRFGATSTLAQSEAPQENRTLQRVREKEDESEVNFRPSYTGGGSAYALKTYTPTGSAESGASQGRGTQTESTLQRQDQFIARQETQSEDSNRSAGRPESSYARSEVNRDSEQKEKERRRHMM